MLWEVPIERRVDRIQVTGDGTLLGTGEEGILAFDPDTGAGLWTYPRGQADRMEVYETGEPGVVAVVSRLAGSAAAADGPSYALLVIEAATGRARWRTAPAPGEVTAFEGAADRDRLLLLVRDAEGGGTLFALGGGTGHLVWQAEVGPMTEAPPAGAWDPGGFFLREGDRVFVVDRGETPAAVEAHALSDGDLDWVAYLRGDDGDPLLGSHRRYVLVTGENLHALDPDSGSEAWQVEGAWRALEEQAPWLLLKDRQGRALQVVHTVSGEVRWRRSAPMDPTFPSAVAWLPEGIVVGERGGGSVTYDPVTGRRTARSLQRFRTDPDRELAWAFSCARAVVFVAAQESATLVVAVGGNGDTLWERRLDRLPTVGMGAPGPSDHLLLGPTFRPAEGAANRRAEALWLVVRTASAPTLVRVDTAEGAVATMAEVAATNTTFAVDSSRGRVYYVDPHRNLVGAGW